MGEQQILRSQATRGWRLVQLGGAEKAAAGHECAHQYKWVYQSMIGCPRNVAANALAASRVPSGTG
jgi:hypothetical protein